MLRLLADDLTGALDSAAVFAGEVPVYFDAAPANAAPAAVSAIATATRDVPPATLPQALAPAIAWLAQADVAFKKIDSLVRGNTVDEVMLVAQAGGFERIVFAPAFPQQGRLTLNGNVVMADGSVPPTGSPDLRAALASSPVPVDLPDVRSDDDLRALARDALDPAHQRWLWCGSAGLARALAEVLGLAAAPSRAASPAVQAPAESHPGPRLLVSASHHPVSRRQWQRLRAARPTALAVPEGREGEVVALGAVLDAMGCPVREVLLDLSARVPLSADEAAHRLQGQLTAIAARAPRPSVLAVVGGDTLRGLCHATAARGLVARASTRSGWGLARWLGGPWDGLTVHSRSGAFGDEDDLVEVMAALSA